MVDYVVGVPVDWTNGTGVFPSGTVTLPSNPKRRGFYVQNQDVGTIEVRYSAQKQSDATPSTVSIFLGSGGSSGSQGGVDEQFKFYITGSISVIGTIGTKVAIAELVY